jgi:hypothetical protein
VLQEEDAADKPFGTLLRIYRVQLGWTAGQLAFLYSEAIGKEDPVDVSFIYHLEAGKMKLLDKGRRAILATLVGMPLAAAGISFVTEENKKPLLYGPIDIPSYTSALEDYCLSWQAGTTYKGIKDIKAKVNNLEKAAFYSFSPDKHKLLELLCGYQILQADILSDNFEVTGVAHKVLTNTINVAKESRLYNIYAHALRQRAGMGIEEFEDNRDLSKARQAVNNFHAAEQVQQKVSPFFQGMVDIRRGLAYAYVARDQQEFKDALNILDNASQQIGNSNVDNRVAARLDIERFYYNRASAYLYSSQGSPSAALAELDQITDLKPMTSPRRQVHRDLLYAETYFALGQYPMSVAYAEAGIETSQEHNMNSLFNRFDTVYQHLKSSSYGSSKDVARLGVSVLKAQHPELFV